MSIAMSSRSQLFPGPFRFFSQLSEARKRHSLSEGSTIRKGESWGGFWLNVVGRVVGMHLFYQTFRRYLETCAFLDSHRFADDFWRCWQHESALEKSTMDFADWKHADGPQKMISWRWSTFFPLNKWVKLPPYGSLFDPSILKSIQPTFRQYYGGRLSW